MPDANLIILLIHVTNQTCRMITMTTETSLYQIYNVSQIYGDRERFVFDTMLYRMPYPCYFEWYYLVLKTALWRVHPTLETSNRTIEHLPPILLRVRNRLFALERLTRKHGSWAKVMQMKPMYYCLVVSLCARNTTCTDQFHHIVQL